MRIGTVRPLPRWREHAHTGKVHVIQETFRFEIAVSRLQIRFRMKARIVAIGSLLGALGMAGTASAQEEPRRLEGCGLIIHTCKLPHLTLGLDGGVGATNESGPFGFGTGVGTVTSAGPSWGIRAGVDVYKWIAIEAHYIGIDNHGTNDATPNGSVHMLTSAGTGEFRFTIPFKYVQPYAYLGAGVYHTSITGSSSAKAASPLFSSTEFGTPMGLGIGVPLTGAITFGGEVTYHRLFGEAFADNEEIGGGDFTTFNAVLRARL